MKKIFLTLSFFAAFALFTSCSDNFVEDMLDKVDGTGTATIDDSDPVEFPSSIVMYNKEAKVPCAIGMAMSSTLVELLDMDDLDDLKFPVMAYRLIGEKFKSGANLTVNVTITDEDLKDFDYKSLLNGKFADKNVVGIAESEDRFYIMKTGSIDIKKSTLTKIKGEYSGSAYVISIVDGQAVMESRLVKIEGSFYSRVSPMFGWLSDLQNEY